MENMCFIGRDPFYNYRNCENTEQLHLITMQDCLQENVVVRTAARPLLSGFCISNNIPYTAFYDWFKKTQKKVVPVEVEGIPEELIQSDNTHEDVTEDKPKRTTPHKGSIMVTIRTREGLCIQKKGLDYQGLKTLVEKLEGLC